MIPTRQTQNKINLARTLHQIWKHQGISRSEIARKLELDKSTITDAIQKLMDAGLVEEWKQGHSRPGGGRKPIYLRVNESFGQVVGIEFRPESYRVVFYSLRGEVLDAFNGSHNLGSGDLLEAISDLIGRVRETSSGKARRIIAIGIGISGVVEFASGKINLSIPFGVISSMDLANDLIKRHGIPVLLENDANACAWSELGSFSERMAAGAASEKEAPASEPYSYIAVLGEVPSLDQESRLYAFSVGLGLCINQRVYRGPNHYAGEFRSLFWDGEPEGQFGLKKHELLGFRENQDIRRNIFLELAGQVALFANTLDCNAIYICGQLEHYADEFIPLLEDSIRRNWSYEMFKPKAIEVATSSHGENAVALGAAALILHILFGVPDYATHTGSQAAKIRDLILESMGSRSSKPLRLRA